jgi:uncharacterized YigZ family protein
MNNNQAAYYQTIETIGEARFKDRGSEFIGFAIPITTKVDFKTEIQKIKKLHPKATHHCFAYKLGTDNNEYRSSDDGEPSGTAGKPILGQIESKGLTNCLVIVVRYYGGTMLGVPGLINAYKTTATLCLQTATVVQKPIVETILLSFNYESLSTVLQIIKKHDGQVASQELQLFCLVHAQIPINKVDIFLAEIKDNYLIEVVKEK